MEVPIDESQMSDGAVDLYDKLKLDTNEYARLTFPTERAECQWVHTMRAVVFEQGVPVKETREGRRGSKEVYKTDFAGQRICMGDPEVVTAKGLDPDGCLACRSASNGYQGMAPERRYAVPVIRYECKSKGSVELRTAGGPSAKIYVWGLTWRMWDSLIKARAQIRELYGWGSDHAVSMKYADFILFCEDGGWQRTRIEMPKRPAWVGKDEFSGKVKTLIAELWADEAMRPTEAQLRAACGRAPDAEWMGIDVETVEESWNKVRAFERGETPAPSGAGADRGGSLADDLNELDADLLLGATGPEPGEQHPGGTAEFASEPGPDAMTAGTDDLEAELAGAGPAAEPDDPFGGDTPVAQAAPAAKAAKAEAKQPAAVASNGSAPAASGGPEPESFDDIMDELDQL